MKPRHLLALVLVFTLALTGCHSKPKFTQLAPVDSLAWGDNSCGNLTSAQSAAVLNNELYVLDNPDSVYVYSLQTGQWARTLGGHGEGPGRFNIAQDILALPDGNLLVTDVFNSRLQELTPQGEFVRSVDAVFPVWAAVADGAVYYTTHFASGRSGLFQLQEDDSPRLIFNLQQWMAMNSPKIPWHFCVVDGGFVFHTIQEESLLLALKSGEALDVTFPPPLEVHGQYSWGRPLAYRKGFIAPFLVHTKEPVEGQLPATGDIRSFLVYYDLKGEILHTWEITPKSGVISFSAWTLDGSRAYFADVASGVVYVYNLK